MHNHSDDDDSGLDKDNKRSFKEFECPGCNANNPCEPSGDGDEVLCHYCGSTYLVKMTDSGKPKFKEI